MIHDTPVTGSADGSIRRALLSVFDKAGLADFAKSLAGLGVELLASGGTAKLLADAGIPHQPVEAFTGAKEVLGGRVKTLHPRIHAGILCDRRRPEHLAELDREGYLPIDLVVCNLYAFAAARRQNRPHAEMIEMIDIGGPTLVRAAAKNADGGVTVLLDPSDYPAVLAAVKADKKVPGDLRRRLAAKAFASITAYDLEIADYTAAVAAAPADGPQTSARPAVDALPAELPRFVRAETLRYGENPHQPAALYRELGATSGIALGTVLTGKPLSYNNYLDMDGAYRAAAGAASGVHRCVIVKHTNPCGFAEAKTQAEAFLLALAGDPVSAFGGIIGLSTPFEHATAEAIKEKKLFVECIVAPAFADDARAALEKREDLRLFVAPPGSPLPGYHAHRIGGGLLVQAPDPGLGDTSAWKVVTKRPPSAEERDGLIFAMEVVGNLKSNAIAIGRGRALLGAGAGQMSRIDACKQALEKAGAQSRGAVLASDAFFPFDDCVRLAATAGISAIVQPGGSKRDDDSIKACDELGLAMIFSGRRHFRH